jgi:TonB-linked SusC/RagA family outer membrane protein
MKQLFLFLLLMLGSISYSLAQKSIKGIVTDPNGQAIIGVNIIADGSPNVGAITDIDGKFNLQLPTKVQSLTFNFLGYETKTIKLYDGVDDIKIMLEESTKLIDEVMVIGYGSSSKRNLTDNVAKLTSDDISNITVSNFQNTMSGKAAGVRINQTNGKVEGGINVRIRGTSSLSQATEPLYVLDGMPLINQNESSNGAVMNPLLSLSPSEIESIDILKDASSAAIYGARGANGVVLITTKKGKVGKTNVSLNISSGISSPTNVIKVLNAAQYKELFTEAAINSLGEDAGKAEAEGFFDFVSNGTDWRNGAVDTDWGKVAFRDGSQSDMDLSISGGDAKTQYFFGGALNKTKGIILGNDLQRLSARMNLKHQLSSNISAGMNLGISKTIIDRVANDNEFVTPSSSIEQSPLSPALNEDGTPNPNTLYPNFLLEDRYADFTTNLHRITGKVFAEYNIIQNLKFNSDLGYDLSNQTENQYRGRLTPFMATNGFAYNSNAKSENYIWSNYFTYNKEINKTSLLTVVAGQEFSNSDRIFNSVSGVQFPSDDFKSISSAAEITQGKGQNERYNFLSYFARASFMLQDKYFVKASIRRDGSSRFGANQRYGVFPAMSVGWLVSEESFLKDFNTISLLKVRASYGQLGNSEIGNFASKSLYNGVSYNRGSGIRLTQPGNNDLTWEKSKQLDLGIEFGLFKDRISGELDFYSKRTDGLLFNVPLPGSSGQLGIYKNIGEVENKGIELVLNSKNITSKNFEWTTNLNISNNANKIISLPNNNADIIFFTALYRVGHAAPTFYLPEYAGVDPNNGDALYYINGKGSETTANYSEAKPVLAGNTQPIWIGGLTNEVSYKGLALSFTFVGEWGASIYNGFGEFTSSNGNFFGNQTVNQLNRWQKVGDITEVPQARLYGGNGNAISTRYLQKADFIRLRNVMLSYDIPSSILGKVKIRNARIYLSGVNLLTFTEYDGFDPESRADANSLGSNYGIDYESAPQAKTTSIGLNINF